MEVALPLITGPIKPGRAPSLRGLVCHGRPVNDPCLPSSWSHSPLVSWPVMRQATQTAP
jgi:hypothetical protein